MAGREIGGGEHRRKRGVYVWEDRKRIRVVREEEGGLWPWGRWEVVKNVDVGGEGKGVRGGGGEVEQLSAAAVVAACGGGDNGSG